MYIKYSEKSVKQLMKIYVGDSKGVEAIIRTIETYAEKPNEKFDVKILKGKFGDFKRLRVGTYRIIFENDEMNMYIYEIKHRKEANK
ncbi:MAG: type II toxin-antitoxin system RelE/ParE family toxin [Nitrospirae bacterium]|nr:type II toxin-antitoxin system RelE/ParE family toxin [Nitrospirota bacterium]